MRQCEPRYFIYAKALVHTSCHKITEVAGGVKVPLYFDVQPAIGLVNVPEVENNGKLFAHGTQSPSARLRTQYCEAGDPKRVEWSKPADFEVYNSMSLSVKSQSFPIKGIGELLAAGRGPFDKDREDQCYPASYEERLKAMLKSGEVKHFVGLDPVDEAHAAPPLPS